MTNKNYPLSSPQREIWFDQMLHPDVPLYNIGGYVQIDGMIEPFVFEQALQQVIQENDALRIIIQQEHYAQTQTILEKFNFQLNFQNFSSKNDPQQYAIDWMQQKFLKPFQFYEQPLFQFALFKIADNSYYWFKKYHHIIIDGWGISLIVHRVATAYSNLMTGEILPRKSYSYSKFVEADIKYLNSAKYHQHQRYWNNYHFSEPFLIDRHTNQPKTIHSPRSVLTIKRSFYNQLIDFAKTTSILNSTSVFHIILGVLYCYFVKTQNREDFTIGISVLNRSNSAFKQTVGLFTTAIPVCFDFGTTNNFIDLIIQIKLELRKGYRNQRFPPSEINVGGRKFNLAIAYAKHDHDIDFNGNHAKATYLNNIFYPQREALSIFVEEFHLQDDVNIYFDYNLNFFSKEEIERLKSRVDFLLKEVLVKPDIPIWQLQMMPDTELHKLLVEFNDTKIDYPQDKTIVDLFEDQVEKTPDNIAVVFENEQLTYRELNNKANQLAHYLQKLGVKPEVLVGIFIERSLEMIIGLLGVLKAGGAYLP
ncbi:MAG: AMP-binding protein, partial [Candidatus Marithrix sp.]|nr:AMP-binding protein [Candidatus Marithrix sp.]